MDPPPSGLADATFELDPTTRYHITYHELPVMSSLWSEAGPLTLATPQLPARAPPRSDHDKLVEILAFIQSLGLCSLAFSISCSLWNLRAKEIKFWTPLTHSLTKATSPSYVDDILTRIYEHRFSAPKPLWPGGGNIGQASRLLHTGVVKQLLREWRELLGLGSKLHN